MAEHNPFYPRGGAVQLAKLGAKRRLWPDKQHTAQFSIQPFEKDLVCRKGFVPGSAEANFFGLHQVLINIVWHPERAIYRMVIHCGEHMNISAQPHLLRFYDILRTFVREQHVTLGELDQAPVNAQGRLS